MRELTIGVDREVQPQIPGGYALPQVLGTGDRKQSHKAREQSVNTKKQCPVNLNEKAFDQMRGKVKRGG